MNILTTDFHTHILPKIDDGSNSVEDSLEMLRKEQADGVHTVLLTPHFYPQEMYPETFLENRQLSMEQLQRSFPKDADLPKLIPGAEIYYYTGISQWEQLDMLTLGDSKYVLIEMPFSTWSENIYAELKQIYFERGLTPIIAHVERYLSRFRMNRVLNRLLESPALLQMNCEYLTDKRTQRTALKLISSQKIHLIGSDCHSPQWRSPIMAQAREILLTNVDKQTLSFLANNEELIVKR